MASPRSGSVTRASWPIQTPPSPESRLVDVEGAAIDWTRVSVGVMRDGLNEEWKQRYLAEAVSPDAVPEIEDLR